MRNPLIPKKDNSKSKFIDVPHSAGILDDFAVRKNVATREGTIEKVPVNNSDIANKLYVDKNDPVHWHSKLSASDGTPNDVLTIDSSGNVDIGTGAGEDAILEVKGTGAYGIYTDANTGISAKGGAFGVTASGNVGVRGQGTTYDFLGRNSSFKVYAGGNVDINGNLGVTGTITGNISRQFAIFRDEKAQGTNGGTSVAGAYYDRTLNTTSYNNITGASLSSNQITLLAGTYYINAFTILYASAYIKARIYNVTNSTSLIIGASLRDGAAAVTLDIPVNGIITLTGTTVIKLQYYCSTGLATYGLGLCGNLDTEVYSEVIIEKIG